MIHTLLLSLIFTIPLGVLDNVSREIIEKYLGAVLNHLTLLPTKEIFIMVANHVVNMFIYVGK